MSWRVGRRGGVAASEEAADNDKVVREGRIRAFIQEVEGKVDVTTEACWYEHSRVARRAKGLVRQSEVFVFAWSFGVHVWDRVYREILHREGI